MSVLPWSSILYIYIHIFLYLFLCLSTTSDRLYLFCISCNKSFCSSNFNFSSWLGRTVVTNPRESGSSYRLVGSATPCSWPSSLTFPSWGLNLLKAYPPVYAKILSDTLYKVWSVVRISFTFPNLQTFMVKAPSPKVPGPYNFFSQRGVAPTSYLSYLLLYQSLPLFLPLPSLHPYTQ